MSGICGARIAVTGAGGFVGRHTVAALAREGACVHALIGPPQCGIPVPQGAQGWLEADVCDGTAIRKWIHGVDMVVHMAGLPSVAGSFEGPAEYVRVHAEGTAAVLDAIRRSGQPRLVYVSSAEVYGRPTSNPVSEDHRLQARSPYAAAKIAAEKLIEASHWSFGTRAVVLRPFSLYGPGASPGSLIREILKLARGGGRIVLRDLQPVRDYCFVGDFADAVVRACSLQEAGLTTLNIGTMIGTSVAGIAAIILAQLGSGGVVEQDRSPGRPGESDIFELIADITRARGTLGWQPQTALSDGLSRVILESLECAV